MLAQGSRVGYLMRCRSVFSRHSIITDRLASKPFYAYAGRAEHCLQARFPQPARARATAIEIEGGNAKLRIGVTGKVRFGQQVKAGDAARRGELMPLTVADHFQIKLADDPLAQSAHVIEVCELL